MINIQKAAIIGCGFVGASIAYALMQKGTFSEIVLLDANEKKADGSQTGHFGRLPFTILFKRSKLTSAGGVYHERQGNEVCTYVSGGQDSI